MDEWYRMVQTIVEDIDRHIRKRDDEALTLSALSQKLGFSEYYMHTVGPGIWREN